MINDQKLTIDCLTSGPGSSSNNMVVFEGSEATNVTAYFGSTAILSCKIRNMIEDNPVNPSIDN